MAINDCDSKSTQASRNQAISSKRRCQVLHLLLKRNPDRYKLTQQNWKKLLNNEHTHNYLLCWHFDCSTLHVDIVVLDSQLYVKIHLEDISLTVCTTLAEGLNENRAIESSDKNVRSHKRETDSCAIDRRSESINHRGSLRIKQGARVSGSDKPSATENFEKRNWWWFELFNVLLIMSAHCRPVLADPLVSSKEVLQSKQLLHSTYCNQETLYSLNAYCQTDESSLDLLIESCKFRELCDKDEKPVCMDTENGSVFVCMVKSLTCAKGYKITAWVEDNKPGIVKLQEEKCPNGTFQSYESDCIHACFEKHRGLAHVSEKYIVYSKGDNVSPVYVYCNYMKGFFNGEGEFLLDYDRDEIHRPYFCEHINDIQPCKGGQYPLPNGTCVGHCQGGIERNAPDFVCKLIDVTDTGSNVIPTSTPVTRASPLYDTLASQEEVTTERSDETLRRNENVRKEVFPLWKVLLIVGSFTGVAIIGVLSWLGVRRCRKRDSRTAQNSRSAMGLRRMENNHSTKIGNQSIIIKNATNVTIHSNQSRLSASFVESEGDALLQSENRMVTFDYIMGRQENGRWEEDGEEESYRPLTDNTDAKIYM